jgi:hypothetical protein
MNAESEAATANPPRVIPLRIQHSAFIILHFLHGSSFTDQYLFSVAMISTNAARVTGLRM